MAPLEVRNDARPTSRAHGVRARVGRDGMRRMFSDGRCDLPVTPSLRGWAGGATRRLHVLAYADEPVPLRTGRVLRQSRISSRSGRGRVADFANGARMR